MTDAFGKITNVAELALLAGIVYFGYKLLKPLPEVVKPVVDAVTPEGDKPVILQPNPLKTATDLLGFPGAGGDMLRGPNVLPTNIGTMFGQAAAQPTGAAVLTLVTSKANPLLYWTNNFLNLFGAGWKVPGQTAQQAQQKRVAAAVTQVQAGGLKSILVSPGASQAKPKTSQSMGGTGSEIQDTPGILDYIRIGPAKQSELDPAYRSTPGAVAPTTTYYKSTSGEPAVSSTPSPGFISVVVPITNVQQPVKPITVPAPPVYTAPPPAPTNLSTPALPSGQIAYNWTTGQTSRLAMQGYNWITMSESEAKSRGLIK